MSAGVHTPFVINDCNDVKVQRVTVLCLVAATPAMAAVARETRSRQVAEGAADMLRPPYINKINALT